MSRRIIIEAVAQSDMREQYQEPGNLGDWFVDDVGDIVIRVVGADPLGHDEAFLVALHELVEMKLCQRAGISQEEVDAFDATYEGGGEPGDDPASPYRKQHRKACLIEFLVADMLGMVGYGKVE